LQLKNDAVARLMNINSEDFCVELGRNDADPPLWGDFLN